MQEYAVNDGQNGVRRFGVRYRDGRYDRRGFGFLGFGERIVTDLDTNAGTATFYDNVTLAKVGERDVYPFANQMHRQWRWAPALPNEPKQNRVELGRDANGGKIRSDLAGYVHPCTRGSSIMCTEKSELKDPKDTPKVADEERAEVDHVASRKDPRCCVWGTNSNKNAAVISRRLNLYFSNHERPKNVAEKINAIPPYAP